MSSISFPPADHPRAAAISASRDEIWRNIDGRSNLPRIVRYIEENTPTLYFDHNGRRLVGKFSTQRVVEIVIRHYLPHLETVSSYAGVLMRAVVAERSIAARERFSWWSTPTWIWNRICCYLGSSPLVRRYFGAYLDRRDQTIAAEQQLRDAAWNLVGRMAELNQLHDDLKKHLVMEKALKQAAGDRHPVVHLPGYRSLRNSLMNHLRTSPRNTLPAWDDLRGDTDEDKVLAACGWLNNATRPARKSANACSPHFRKLAFAHELCRISFGLSLADCDSKTFRDECKDYQGCHSDNPFRDKDDDDENETAVDNDWHLAFDYLTGIGDIMSSLGMRELLQSHLPADDAHAPEQLRQMFATTLPTPEATVVVAWLMRKLRNELHAERARGEIAADDPLLSFIDTPADIWERDCSRATGDDDAARFFRCMNSHPAMCLSEAVKEVEKLPVGERLYKKKALNRWLLAARGGMIDEAGAAIDRHFDYAAYIFKRVQHLVERDFSSGRGWKYGFGRGGTVTRLKTILHRTAFAISHELKQKYKDPGYFFNWELKRTIYTKLPVNYIFSDDKPDNDPRKLLSLFAGSADRADEYMNSLTVAGCAEQMFRKTKYKFDDIAVEMSTALVRLRGAQMAREQASTSAPEPVAELA